jgi:hypothetical protein
MVWYNPTTWENPLKGWWGAPAEEEGAPAVDTAELAPAPAAETESEMPTTTGGRRKKHRKTKRSKKSKSKKTGRKH